MHRPPRRSRRRRHSRSLLVRSIRAIKPAVIYPAQVGGTEQTPLTYRQCSRGRTDNNFSGSIGEKFETNFEKKLAVNRKDVLLDTFGIRLANL